VGYLVEKSLLLWAFFEHFRLSLANHIVLSMLHIHLRGDGAIGISEAMAPSDSVSRCYRKIPEKLIFFSKNCDSKINTVLIQ
jgi:hypothetical protein